jgi:hypothetical protein
MTQRFSRSLTIGTFKASIALALSSAIISGTAAHAEVYKADPRDEIKFETKRWAKNFINIENGPIAVTTIKDEAWSSRWYLEPVGEGDYVRIQNRWTGCYLNVENGPMDCGTKDSGTNAGGRWSAQWTIQYEGDGDYAVVNRWTGCRLSTGYLKNMRCSKDNTTAGMDTEYLWRITNLTRDEAAKQKAGAKKAADAAQADRDKVRSDSGDCLVMLSESDDGGLSGLGGLDSRCVNYSAKYIGDEWNDDVEIVHVKHPRAQVTLYEAANYGGRSVRLTCGRYELVGDPEDTVSSYVIEIMPQPVACNNKGTTIVESWD